MKGRLLYLMGASGAGKDTVLDGVKTQLGSRVYIAPRIITRHCTPTEKRAISVTPEQFQVMVTQGLLAMAWHANGLSYGIHRDIHHHLERGCDVLVNGSRAYLPQASLHFPELQPVLLHVDSETLRQRLIQRKRETQQQIQERLERNAHFSHLSDRPGISQPILINNSGPAEHAIAALCRILNQHYPNTNHAFTTEQSHA